MTRALFSCLICGVLIPGKLLACQKEDVADTQLKHLLFVWWTSPVLLKEAVANPTKGTVTNSNKIWCVMIFV